jgi:hypothetical protein
MVTQEIQFAHSNAHSLRYTLIVSSHLHLGLSSGLFPFWQPNQNSVCISLHPQTSYTAHSSHPPLLDDPNIFLRVQTVELLIMQFPPASHHFIAFRSTYSPNHPILEHTQFVFLSQCDWPCFTPYKTNCKIKVLYILNPRVFDSIQEDKRFWTTW